MKALIPALDSALLNFVWQGVAVASLLWLTLAALRRTPANARYLASCAALGVLALMPVVTAWSACARQTASGEAAVTFIDVTAARIAAVPVYAGWAGWWTIVQAWLAPVWACGVLLLSIRMLWGCARVSRLKREGEVADRAVAASLERLAQRLRVTKRVRMLISSLAEGPSVVGWMKPVVLLPAATVLGLSQEQLEAVLVHELAHIRRYDYLVNLIQMLIETLFFYHPAVWWISRRIREERELCCDDIAVRTCGDAVCYARALTALEKMRTPDRSLALGAKDGPLRYRIERLLGIARREPLPSRLPGMIAICLGLACLAPVPHAVRAQAPPPAASAAPKPAPASAPPAARAQATPRNTPQSDSSNVVAVYVTVDSSGAVADARVLNGPLGLRRQALQAALNMTFPRDAAATRRLIVQISPSQLKDTQRQKAEESTDFLRNQLLELQRDGAAMADESRMRIQQIQNQIQVIEMQLEQVQRNGAGAQPVR